MKNSILLFITILVFVFAVNLTINIYAEEGHKSHNKKSEEKDTTDSCCNMDSVIKVYICPMEEHKNTAYANPGDCPLCGMKLKGKNVCEVYVCPMEEHQEKLYIEKGICPECGMELIKVKEVPKKAKKYKPKK